MANENKNVKISFEAWVAAQLETGQSLTVNWQGTQFDPAAVDTGASKNTAYITPRSLGKTSGAARRTKRRELWLFQFTISVLVGFDEFNQEINDTHRLWEIADLIEAEFGQYDLAVLDYGGGGEEELFRLRFEEMDLRMLPSSGNEDESSPRWQNAAMSVSAWVIT